MIYGLFGPDIDIYNTRTVLAQLVLCYLVYIESSFVAVVLETDGKGKAFLCAFLNNMFSFVHI